MIAEVFLEKWRLANSRVSLNAGAVRIRLEATGLLEDRQQLAQGLAGLPELVAAAENAWRVLVALSPDPVAIRVQRQLTEALKPFRAQKSPQGAAVGPSNASRR